MFSYLTSFLRPRQTQPIRTQPRRSGCRPLSSVLEALEDRTVPAGTLTATFAGTTLTVAAVGDAGETINFGIAAGALTINSTVDNITAAAPLTGGGTMSVTLPAANTATLTKIVVTGDSTSSVSVENTNKGVNLTATNLPALTELDVFEAATNGNTIDYSSATKNIYTLVSFGGGTGNTFKPNPSGVNIVQFGQITTAASLNINTTTALKPTTTTVTASGNSYTVTTGGVLGLDFRNSQPAGTNGVSVNLKAGANGTIAGYANGANTSTVTATDPTAVTAVVGSVGNDNIVGNDKGDLLIGFGGTDTITGGNGNNEMYAVLDTTPAYGGTVGTVLGQPGVLQQSATSTTNIDPSKITTLASAFATAANTASFTQTSIINTLSYIAFNFGNGVSFLNGSINLATDLTNATNATPTVTGVTDLLFTGSGSNSIFGFAGVHITANAAGGNNNVGSAFSTSLSNTWQFGGGMNNTYTIAFGDVVNAATNNPTATGTNVVFFVGGTPNVPTFITFGGKTTNTVHLDNGAKQVNISTGSSKTTITGGASDPTNIATLDAASSVVPPLTITTAKNGL
jgi:hypothetical protein